MVFSHIHYNTQFEFCTIILLFFSSFFHKKYAPPKVSNFWGAYQFQGSLLCNTDISAYSVEYVIKDQATVFSLHHILLGL